jgi:hypothetical protein
MNGYELSRNWFDWSFENPELVSPPHTAIYFFAIEHCNRLGWKDKFGFPSQLAMDAIGIKKHQTFIKHFTDLIDWGFIKLIQKSKNQYSANVISLISALPKNGKALDKALVTHEAKQSQSNGQSMDSIDKQQTSNLKPQTNNIEQRKLKFADTLKPFLEKYTKDMMNDFYKYWTQPNKAGSKFKQELEKTWELSYRLETWARNDKSFNKSDSQEVTLKKLTFKNGKSNN